MTNLEIFDIFLVGESGVYQVSDDSHNVHRCSGLAGMSMSSYCVPTAAVYTHYYFTMCYNTPPSPAARTEQKTF